MAFEARGEVARRRWSLVVGAAVLFATSLVLMAIGAPHWGAFIEHVLSLTLLVAFFQRFSMARRKGVLAAGRDGLALDGKLVVPRAHVSCAYVVPGPRAVVRIVRHGRTSVDVSFDDEAEAAALVTALGFDARQAVARFRVWTLSKKGSARLGTPLAVLAVFVMGGVMREHAYPGSLAGALAAAALAVVVVVALFYARVEVGKDGILVRSLARRRFLSHADLTGSAVDANALVITPARGEPLRLATDVASLGALAQRVDEAWEAFADAAGAPDDHSVVAPEGRTAAGWLRDLRARTDGRAYRVGRRDADALGSLLDDASLPPATRAGAAVALASLDERARPRIRVAADACAEPRLRLALARVADDAPDEALTKALEPLLALRR
ncbi:MAG TPA: hypothetical protein VIY73_18290 [Polyangiaceae bacterium]